MKKLFILPFFCFFSAQAMDHVENAFDRAERIVKKTGAIATAAAVSAGAINYVAPTAIPAAKVLLTSTFIATPAPTATITLCDGAVKVGSILQKTPFGKKIITEAVLKNGMPFSKGVITIGKAGSSYVSSAASAVAKCAAAHPVGACIVGACALSVAAYKGYQWYNAPVVDENPEALAAAREERRAERRRERARRAAQSDDSDYDIEEEENLDIQ